MQFHHNGPYSLMKISLFNVSNESTYIINNVYQVEDYVIINGVDDQRNQKLQRKMNSHEKETRADSENKRLCHRLWMEI
jgi:hypothetical protein